MLHGWDNFFIMAGTAAATLIGLLFVAVTVGTGFSTSRIVHGTGGFLTPTLIRFGGVLFLSLAVLAPWPSARPIGVILGMGGLMDLAYQVTLRHTLRWPRSCSTQLLSSGSEKLAKLALVSARRVEPGCETSVPGSNGRLVSDLIDLDPTFEQTAPRGLEVRDDEIDVAE